MIGFLQRVTKASVVVAEQTIAQIDTGLLVLVGIERSDTKAQADHLLYRFLTEQFFPDKDDKKNLNLTDIKGGLLLVPRFTLPEGANKGNHMNLIASPKRATILFNYLCTQAKQHHPIVATGQFDANMQINLIVDGPISRWLQVFPPE